MTIRQQFLLTSALMALLPLLLSAFLFARYTSTKHTEDAEENLKGIGYLVKADVESFFSASIESTRQQSLNPTLVSYIESSPEEQKKNAAFITRILQTSVISDPINISSCALLDLDGNVLLGTQPRNIGRNEASNDWFKKTFETGFPHGDLSLIGAQDSKYRCCAILRLSGGPPRGALRMEYESAALKKILRSIPSELSKGVFAAIYDNEGNILSGSSQHDIRPQLIPDSSQVNEIKESQFHGRCFAQPIAGTSWRLVVFQDNDVFMTRVTRLKSNALKFSVALTILIIVASNWIAAKTTRPIDILAGAARSVAEGNLESKVNAQGPKEIAQLGESFNLMINQLKESLKQQHEKMLELSESEERFRQLVENSHELVSEVSMEGVLLYVSPNHENILGWIPEELVNTPVLNLVRLDKVEEAAQALEERHSSGVFPVKTKDGSSRWLETTSSVFDKPDGSKVAVLVSRDITTKLEADRKRKNLEEQLLQSQKLESLGTLAGGVAHDFNNLLTVIIGNLHFAKTDTDEALTAAERAKEIVSQILTFSRKKREQLEPQDLGKIVTEASGLLSSLSPANIQFSIQVDETASPVLCDQTHMHQIITNLGTNAIHAMETTGGELKVELNSLALDSSFRKKYSDLTSNHAVHLSVVDTGQGMDKESLTRIFEPFFTTKAVGKGTGLGLSVIHGIITSLDGRIHVESEFGTGTSFHLFFKGATSKAPDGTQEETTTFKTNTKGKTIALVDDDAGVRRITARYIRDLGYGCKQFESGEQLIENLTTNSDISAILTDLSMP